MYVLNKCFFYTSNACVIVWTIFSFQPKSQVFFLKVFILLNNQLLSTGNAKGFNTDYYCSDFRNESYGKFVVGVIFVGIFFIHSKIIVVLSLNLERYFLVIICRKVLGV